MPSTAARLTRCICRPAPCFDIDGNAMTTTNCGRNSTALDRISPAAYNPAWCSSSVLRAMITSALDSAKKASSACELWNVSRSTPPGAQRWLSAVNAAGTWTRRSGRRSAHQPTTTGTSAPSVTPTMAPSVLGSTISASVPNPMRPSPTAR